MEGRLGFEGRSLGGLEKNGELGLRKREKKEKQGRLRKTRKEEVEKR